MIIDLLLALASVAIVLAPCVMDALGDREPHKPLHTQHGTSTAHMTS
jgi:hypothetical protein